jgi:hypothetical protein
VDPIARRARINDLPAVPRVDELEHHRLAAGSEHPRHLAHGGFLLGRLEVLDDRDARHEVEGPVREVERGRRHLAVLDRRGGRFAGRGEHLLGGIHP